MPEVTLVVTSCDRHDLLERTLRSFAKFNTCPIQKTVIVEDGAAIAPAFLAELPELGPIQWIRNMARKGQVYSVDRAYAEVDTPYIFHCEDDWEFTRSGFIEESLEILSEHPQVWTVSLRGDDCNTHPNLFDEDFELKIQEPYWNQFWGGCNWNPGLRRIFDYEQIGSYGRICGYGQGGIHGEQTLSKLHLDMGYRIAVLSEAAVTHIGERRSKACQALPAPPKVLIAIPACHRYQYKEYQDKRIGHVDRMSNHRVKAICDTWAKDVAAFSNAALRFFYGNPVSGERPGVSLHDKDAVVKLDVSDDYVALPHKVKAIVEYALTNGYDYLFKADDDTFVYVDRLLASGFENRTYTGYCYPSHGNYISGGPGYWLNRKAMQKVAAAAVEGWAEDKWVGETLRKANLRPERDARYLPGFDRHYVDLDQLPEKHGYISLHACTPEMMQRLYQSHPRPTFLQQPNAMGEGHYPNAENFELNVRPLEAISQQFSLRPESAGDGRGTDGRGTDPRRPQTLQLSKVQF